jgi:hypothetical protein
VSLATQALARKNTLSQENALMMIVMVSKDHLLIVLADSKGYKQRSIHFHQF